MESLSTSVSLVSQCEEITTKEYLRICCKISYQPRRLKNKGAILILMWMFLVMFACRFLTGTVFKIVRDDLFTTVIIAIITLMLPIAGWLADVRFGRYKVICWSIWTMWIGCLLLAASHVVVNLIGFYDHHIYRNFVIAWTAVSALGFGGFQANLIQFGIDQLTDASTTEITSYIAWYAWSLLSGELPVLLFSCIDSNPLIDYLLMFASLCLVISSNFFFNSQLIKEPATQNPFKLIYKVIQYAIRNKQPRLRSAFTYCEDDQPSRIDIGKTKYGGPFTTEQVEDVKTFFRIIGLVAIGGAVFAMKFDDTNPLKRQLSKVLISSDKPVVYRQCLYDNFPFLWHSIVAILGIPLNEFLIHPIFQRCLKLKIKWKVFVGIIILLAAYIVLTVMITYSRKILMETGISRNDTDIQCFFHESATSLKHAVDFKWFAIPELLFVISDIFFTVGVVEFYCAQFPYSMKGLLIGCFYGFTGVFVLFNYGVSLFFKKSDYWQTQTIFSCGFWYLQTYSVVMVIIMFLSLFLFNHFKRRKRQDVLPNEHIFAEKYYSRDD